MAYPRHCFSLFHVIRKWLTEAKYWGLGTRWPARRLTLAQARAEREIEHLFTKWWNGELTLKCKLKCYVKPMKNPLSVSPSKRNQGTTRSKEKNYFHLGGNRTHDLRIRWSTVALPTKLKRTSWTSKISYLFIHFMPSIWFIICEATKLSTPRITSNLSSIESDLVCILL